MKDIALHQATNKTVRPLTEQMAGPAPAAGKDPAGQAAASLPAAGLSELAGGMLPSLPDLVPFPILPRARPARFGGRLPASGGMPQALSSLPGMPAGAAPMRQPGAAAPQAPAPPAAAAAEAAAAAMEPAQADGPEAPGRKDRPAAAPSPEDIAADALNKKPAGPASPEDIVAEASGGKPSEPGAASPEDTAAAALGEKTVRPGPASPQDVPADALDERTRRPRRIRRTDG
ncbi:hypothetical protein [Inquilinus limosus]|nr:hypothetical protein [Inquilinus limosus]